jgi:hypothetical protein
VDMSDGLSGSVLDGFSVPPALVQLRLTTQGSAVLEAESSVHCPVLTTMPFHPPV